MEEVPENSVPFCLGISEATLKWRRSIVDRPPLRLEVPSSSWDLHRKAKEGAETKGRPRRGGGKGKDGTEREQRLPRDGFPVQRLAVRVQSR